MLYKLITLAMAFFIMSANAAWQKPILVKAVTIRSHELFDKYSIAGLCRNNQSRDYYANVAGTIEFISPQQGQKIAQGDLIIAIDRELAETIRAKNQAALHLAKVLYERDQVLFEKKVISKIALDTSIADLEKTKYESVQAMNTYDDMVIVAPFDGSLGVMKIKANDHVKIGDYLFSIVQSSPQTIILELPESIYKSVNPSTGVKIIDINGNTIDGEITSVSEYLSDNGTVRAQVNINDSKFMHGSYVHAELIINKHHGLAVPEQSVLQNENGNFVYKISGDNTIKQVYVKLGTRTNDLIEIIANDLHDGDNVILEGFTKVQDGVVVKILD